jgi:phage repressor protein C with HTH and peptisase S24 domain
MMEKHDRLKTARQRAGFETATEAAQRFGWAISTYVGHESGARGFKDSTAIDYARAFRCPPEWILLGRGMDDAEASNSIAPMGETLVPVYNAQASAGYGAIVGDEYVISQISFPPGYLQKLTCADPRNLKIIGVKGDSMLPSLSDDDVVMLDTSKRDLSFDGLFVIRDDGDALLVKRIGRAGRKGFVMVISDNPLYPTAAWATADIEVIGKVIWTGRKV